MTVFIRQEPLPGETLAGLIARTASTNGYAHAHDILSQCEGGAGRNSSISARAASFLPELSRVLGVPEETLTPLTDKSDRKKQTFDFFGNRMRAGHRLTKIRRVSPRALRISGHYRGVWGLKAFSFDPETKEQLIDSCPVCQRRLGFERTNGICHCDWCTTIDQRGFLAPAVDLRDHLQPLIEVDDAEALGLMSGLVDPVNSDQVVH